MLVYVGNCNRVEIQNWYKEGLEIGTLISLTKKAIKAPTLIPYALDNGAYGYFKQGKNFDFVEFYDKLKDFQNHPNKAQWLLVPDCVGKKKTTLEYWEENYHQLAKTNIPLAFAVQDGMTKKDVPKQAKVIFVGGSTEWKLDTLEYWCNNFYSHIGRVNTWKRLWICKQAGAKSVDGTGFMRHSIYGQPAIDLLLFLKIQSEAQEISKMLELNPRQRRKLLESILGEKIPLPTPKNKSKFQLKNQDRSNQNTTAHQIWE